MIEENKAEVEGKEDLALKEFEVVRGLTPISSLSPEGFEKEFLMTQLSLRDPKSPLNNSSDPLHAGAVRRWTLLNERKYPQPTEAAIQTEEAKYRRFAQERLQAADAERAENEFRKTEEFLKAQWGRDFDRNIGLARRVVQRFTTEEDQIFLEQTGLANDPEFINLTVQIGRMLEGRENKLSKKRN